MSNSKISAPKNRVRYSHLNSNRWRLSLAQSQWHLIKVPILKRMRRFRRKYSSWTSRNSANKECTTGPIEKCTYFTPKTKAGSDGTPSWPFASCLLAGARLYMCRFTRTKLITEWLPGSGLIWLSIVYLESILSWSSWRHIMMKISR